MLQTCKLIFIRQVFVWETPMDTNIILCKNKIGMYKRVPVVIKAILRTASHSEIFQKYLPVLHVYKNCGLNKMIQTRASYIYYDDRNSNNNIRTDLERKVSIIIICCCPSAVGRTFVTGLRQYYTAKGKPLNDILYCV